jgi:hypothetical protein
MSSGTNRQAATEPVVDNRICREWSGDAPCREVVCRRYDRKVAKQAVVREVHVATGAAATLG